MLVWLAALLLLLAPALSLAQTAKPKAARKAAAKSEPPAGWPIRTLAVEGNRNYSKEQILGVAALKVGQVATKADFDAARDRVVSTGLFETVGYRFAPATDNDPNKDSTGYSAVFQVLEATPVYPVLFTGLPADPADLYAWLKSKDPMYTGKLPGTAEVISRYARLVEEFLVSKNQSERVVGKLAPSGADQFGVVFRSAAPIPNVAEVKFTGNQLLPSTTLQNKIAQVAIGVPYNEDGFRALVDNALRPLYEARGRVAVAFPKITTEKASDVDGLAATVTVVEGEEFKLGEVKIAGNYAGKSADLLKLGKFKTGETANFDEITQGIERIKKPLQRQGYLHANATIERAIHDKTKIVDVTIRIEEGQQFTMGKLTIEGLDLNGEDGIRKLWIIQPGKPFDAGYPDYFLSRIREDGLFENLHNSKASTKMNDQNHTVDVTLQFH
jgi:outer membrane protein assembly factor BamA